MGLIAYIKLINKIDKAVKLAKKTIDNKEGVAKDLRKVIKQLKLDIESLMTILPDFKDVCLEILDILKAIK